MKQSRQVHGGKETAMGRERLWKLSASDGSRAGELIRPVVGRNIQLSQYPGTSSQTQSPLKVKDLASSINGLCITPVSPAYSVLGCYSPPKIHQFPVLVWLWSTGTHLLENEPRTRAHVTCGTKQRSEVKTYLATTDPSCASY